MKVKSKYLALGLLFGFISCDLFMRDEMKEESLGLLNEKGSILGASEKSVKRPINKNVNDGIARKKDNGKVGRKETYTHHIKRKSANNSNLLQKIVMSGEERLKPKLLKDQFNLRKEKIQKQQDAYIGITQGSLNFLSGESGELNETIESNEIDCNIDSDLKLKSGLQTISGSNLISSMYEIEEEDYYDYDDYYEEIRLSNRYESSLKSVEYNVDLAIKTIDKIYNNYSLFSTKQTQMYSTFLDSTTKIKAKEEAKRFKKEELQHDLKNLLNYIQISVKTVTNFVYISEIHAKKRLDNIEAEVKKFNFKDQRTI
ncbi:ferrous iron transporter A [Borreliella valaisiana]|uniref:ferrous iron transporter A n=1 Tax=Borreliella valaisiana TaxID=62088 RepID=UPI003B21C28A